MNNASELAAPRSVGEVVESVVTKGDLSGLNTRQLTEYYVAECVRMGLDPLSRPFDLLRLQGKLVMYANRRCADMLAAKHNVTRTILEDPQVRKYGSTELLYCKVRVSLPSGRVEEDVATLPATDLVNAVMKIATKAARRATLKVCGWGGMDELELETVRGAERVTIEQIGREHAEGETREIETEGELVEPASTLHGAAKTLRDELAKASGGREMQPADMAEAIDRHYTTIDEEGSVGAAYDALKGMVAKGTIGKLKAIFDAQGQRVAAERRAWAWTVEALDETEGETGTVAALKGALRDAKTCDDVLARYNEARASLAELADEGDKAAAWSAVVARWAQTTNVVDRKTAQKDLVSKLPKNPDGGGSKTRKRNAPAAAQGAANESGEATGPVARAALPESAEYAASPSAWEAHCASWNSPYAVENGWVKHQPSFDAAGVREARLRVAAARWANLRHCDEDVACRRLLTVEADALRAAQTPTIASRRAKRDRDERMGPRTLADMVMPRAAGWR